jgi:hypothetical protein
MYKTGLQILGGSFAAAAFLVVIWFIGFLTHIGGAQIHLLIVLAMALGFIGVAVGTVVLLMGKKP